MVVVVVFDVVSNLLVNLWWKKNPTPDRDPHATISETSSLCILFERASVPKLNGKREFARSEF